MKVKKNPFVSTCVAKDIRAHFHAPHDGGRVFSRVIKYCAFSILCAALDFGLYALFLLWFPAIGAYIAARVISAVVNYQVNRRIVFRATGSIRRAIGYLLLALLVMSLGSLSVNFLIQIGFGKVLSKMLIDSFLFICNYLSQKKLIFRKEK